MVEFTFSRNLKRQIIAFLVLLVTFLQGTAYCGEVSEPGLWGLVMSVRLASVPFVAEDGTDLDIIPLLYYDEGRFYLHGLETGFIFYNDDKWRISALGRYRFFNVPDEYQQDAHGSTFDIGGQLRYTISDYFHSDIELLSDEYGAWHANFTGKFEFSSEPYELWPYFTLRYKSDKFNNTYYGLSIREPGQAIDYSAGIEARFHLISNLYLVGKGALTLFDNTTYDLDIIDDRVQAEAYLGLGVFKHPKDSKRKLSSKPYLRLAHGWTTPSSLAEILTGNTEQDPYNNQMSSVFLGVPVSDELFGLPIPVYLTPGYAYHHASEVQDQTSEFILAIKGYYKFNWPIGWRLGVAEGLSYAVTVPYVEQVDMEDKGYDPSNLMNFLDLSLDINLGDLFRTKKLQGLWLGYSIHHRSGMFETSSMFGNVKGGSNINTVYLQYHW
jgi:outer membrane protein